MGLLIALPSSDLCLIKAHLYYAIVKDKKVAKKLHKFVHT
jgi:hypothetical protein